MTSVPLPGFGATMPCPECGGSGVVPYAPPTTPRPGPVGRVHPSTSRTAAYHPGNIPRFGAQRHRCMLALLPVLPDGLTAAEISERVRLSRNQTATRMWELREDGFVTYLVVDGRRVMRPTGPRDDGLVQTLTRRGIAVLEEMERRRSS